MKSKRTARALLAVMWFRRKSNATPMERFGFSYMLGLYAWIWNKK